MVQYQEHHLGGGGHSHFWCGPHRILHEGLLKIFVAGTAVLPPDHQFHVSESVVGIELEPAASVAVPNRLESRKKFEPF
jgi:hypothetical protein